MYEYFMLFPLLRTLLASYNDCVQYLLFDFRNIFKSEMNLFWI